MTKTHHANKETKKKPLLTHKEKKAAKLEKQKGGQSTPIVPKS
jgi:hypothetical protein